jgi:uncharacterized protein
VPKVPSAGPCSPVEPVRQHIEWVAQAHCPPTSRVGKAWFTGDYRASYEETDVAAPRKLNPAECVALLGTRGVGRVAICGATGPQIYPVNYVVDRQSVVFRTSASSGLGTLARGAEIAIEVDAIDHDRSAGWSVVATGRAELVDDDAELDRLRERGLEPAPWATGLRRTYVRLAWSDISGRSVGDDHPQDPTVR